MNAPATFPDTLNRAPGAGKRSATPDDHELVVRDQRFGRDAEPTRWRLNGDPVATCWMLALSATFPRGEAFFVESVKAFRDGAPARLAAEIRAFVKQEVNHTREHVAFNRLATESGYDLSGIDRHVEDLLALTKGRPEILNLAATMALEHFTAMLGRELLETPQHLDGSDRAYAELWRWHAAEEIEHKGVAYDVWLHATRDWSRWKRWKVKSLMMLIVTRRFVTHRVQDTLELLRQDGITGWDARRRLAHHLLVKPGFLRRIVPEWFSFFRPGFHPWTIDNRELIQVYDSEFAAANLPG